MSSFLLQLVTPLASPASDTVMEFGQSSVDFTALFLKMIVAMIFVIALALVLIRYVLPRLSFSRVKAQGSAIQILDRIPLDAKNYLCILEVEGRRLLIGVSESRIGMVAELGLSHAAKESSH
jgi:flagellar biogenesis protein FliO